MKKEELVRFIMTEEKKNNNIINHIAHHVATIGGIMNALPIQKYKNLYQKKIPWDFRMTNEELKLYEIRMKMASRRAFTDVWSKMSDKHKAKFLGKFEEDVLREIRDSYRKNKRTNGMERMEKKLLREMKAARKRLEKQMRDAKKV